MPSILRASALNRFAALILAGIAALVGTASGHAQVTQTAQTATAPFVYGGVLVPAPKLDRFSHHVDWINTPTRVQVVGAFPSDVTSAGRTLWSCGIRSDGHLRDCQLKLSWPAAEGFGRAGRSLMPDFQLSDATVGAAYFRNSRVVFEIDIFNDLMSVKAIPGTCPAQFCGESRRGQAR